MPTYQVTNVYTAAVSHIVYADNEDMALELGKAHYDEIMTGTPLASIRVGGVPLNGRGWVEYGFTVVDDVVSDASDLCDCPFHFGN